MNETFLAIINPAAGGGSCGERVGAALDRSRAAGIMLATAETSAAGQATQIAREAYGRGCRKFLAVGGDGTSYEIVNGLFPDSVVAGSSAGTSLGAGKDAVAMLGFLPLGTGNSFLRDFTSRGVEHTIEALRKNSRRLCDVIRLRHTGGEIYFINMLNLGFAACLGGCHVAMYAQCKPALPPTLRLGVFQPIRFASAGQAPRCKSTQLRGHVVWRG